MLSGWKAFDRRGVIRRTAIVLTITLAALLLIDRASLLIAPCGIGGGGYSDQKNANDDNCAIREGIVVAGIEWLSDRPPEVWTALATIAVAFFTWTLWQSSEKLWKITRISTIATRRAANAARKSADVAEAALTVAERPFLVPTEPKMKLWRYGPPGMPPVNPPEYIGTIQYGLFNMGRTVAFLKEVCVRLIFVEILPDSPSYQTAAESPNDTDPKVMAGHYPIGPEKPYDCPTYGIGLKQKMRPDTFNDIQSGKLKAFFFGYVRYTDVFDYLHTEGFCFRYTQIGADQTPSICAIVAGKNYNYSRREKIPPEGFATLPPQGAELTSEDVEKLNAQMRAERGKPV